MHLNNIMGMVNDKIEARDRLVKQLAIFLAENQGGKSILLKMETQHPKPAPMPSLAKEWASLREASLLTGYVTVKEAEYHIRNILMV